MKSATLICTLALVGAAHAQTTTYDYTGALMTGTETYGTLTPTPTGPFVQPASYAAGGLITLAAPLGDNLVDASITPEWALFNIGGNAFAGFNVPSSITSSFPFTYQLTGSFAFSTNASGQITGWDVNLMAMQPGTTTPAPWTLLSTPSGDSSTWDIRVNNSQGSYFLYTVSNNVAGTWRAVPEISSSGAFSGLTLLIGMILIASGTQASRSRES